MEQEQKPRERSFIREIVPDWRPTREQKLWAVRIMLMLVAVLGVLTLIGLPFDITLWNWMDLLIIPVVLAIGGYLFTRSENRATRVAAEQRAQDEALQAYLDQMGQMLLDKERPLRQSQEGAEERTLARAWTLTVLTRLDGERKGSVVRFLYESGLIASRIEEDEPATATNVVYLTGANLSEANLSGPLLGNANLRRANLYRANLGGASLYKADLYRANLRSATLDTALLQKADLRQANLSDAYLPYADLRGADLSGADLSGAYLDRANLSSAELAGADLREAELDRANLNKAKGWTVEQLRAADSLEGATMPNCQKYEDWLKSKGRGEAGENSGP